MSLSSLPPLSDTREFPVSALIARREQTPLDAPGRWDTTVLAPDAGVQVMVQRGALAAPLALRARNDMDCVQFSVLLHGLADFRLLDARRPGGHHSTPQLGTIEYGPQQRWDFRFAQGAYHCVKVMLAPEVFARWCQDADADLLRHVRAGRCFAVQRCDAPLRMQAYQLAQALDGAAAPRQPLWLQAQAMGLVALMLQARAPTAAPAATAAGARALARARDVLLADLCCAPSIAALAQSSGLSVYQLKRGFRQQYGQGVYGVFLRERMHEARRLLAAGNASVMQVASQLGYTNASHFAAAFRHQFGVNPGQLQQFSRLEQQGTRFG